MPCFTNNYSQMNWLVPWKLHVSWKSLAISARRWADTSIRASRETKTTTTTTTASITQHQHWMVEKSCSSHSGNSISVFITVSNQKDASSKSHQPGKKMDQMQINDDREGGNQGWKMKIKGWKIGKKWPQRRGDLGGWEMRWKVSVDGSGKAGRLSGTWKRC